MAIRRKPTTLKGVFLKYLFQTIIALISVFVLVFSLITLSISVGIVIPANATEQALIQAETAIASKTPFNEEAIPPGAQFVWIDHTGTILKSNATENQQNAALSYFHNGTKEDSQYYRIIEREDGYCIIMYEVRAHYNLKWMQQYLPPFDYMIVILLLVGSVLVCAFITWRFANQLKSELIPMMDVAQAIKQQDLVFETQQTSIHEFNQVLNSMDEMRQALKTSLMTQWESEKQRQEQTSALAHDIKTPVTIIRGNAELLQQQLTDEAQQQYITYILKNTERIEQYTSALVEMSRTQQTLRIQRKEYNTQAWIQSLIEEATEFVTIHQKTLDISLGEMPETIWLDIELMRRAIFNILANAIEYSPVRSIISLKIDSVATGLRIVISDQGTGFTQQDLKYAKHQFYRGDPSRHAAQHYGLGLYIVDQIVQLHQGTWEISNVNATDGGCVTIHIPVK